MDIQTIITPNMTFQRQTKIAQYISLAIGIFAILVAMWLARLDVKSAYELFNSFLGQALGALAGVFVLGVFTQKTTALSAFIGFVCATASVFYLKYNVPSISFWMYAFIAIVVTLIVGVIVSKIQAMVTGQEFEAPAGSTFRSATKQA